MPKRGVVALSFLIVMTSRAAADPSTSYISEHRSAAEMACVNDVEVCGFMPGTERRSFSGECAARAEGAKKIFVGPCFDED